VCADGFLSGITELGGTCSGCDPNFYASEDKLQCLACPANTESPAGSDGIWRCKANAGYYAKYTKTIRMTIEVPEEDSDPAILEAYVRAAVGGGDEVRVTIEP